MTHTQPADASATVEIVTPVVPNDWGIVYRADCGVNQGVFAIAREQYSGKPDFLVEISLDNSPERWKYEYIPGDDAQAEEPQSHTLQVYGLCKYELNVVASRVEDAPTPDSGTDGDTDSAATPFAVQHGTGDGTFTVTAPTDNWYVAWGYRCSTSAGPFQARSVSPVGSTSYVEENGSPQRQGRIPVVGQAGDLTIQVATPDDCGWSLTFFPVS
jgi:hypothetical protein